MAWPITDDVLKAPGGPIALILFWLGLATGVSCLVFALMALSDDVFVQVSPIAAFIPGWGIVAIILAVLLRRPRGVLLKRVAGLWMAIGLAGLAVFVFGTSGSWA